MAGGRRVEIKGVARHRGLPRLVHTEAFRQLELLRIRAALLDRGVADAHLPDPPEGRPPETSPLVADVGHLLGHGTVRPLAQAWERGDAILAVRLPGFAGLLGHRTQPGLDFAHELAERVRVIACPVHRPFLTHSDAPDGAGGIGAGDWAEVRKAVGAGSDDAVVVVWAPEPDADTAAREILIRAREALAGVPAETRQATPDGRTRFERLLPGPDRMYPDTDTPPLPIRDALVARVRERLPERPWEREARYRELGLHDPAARRLAHAPWAHLFDAADPDPGVAEPLARALAQRAPYHARRHGIDLAGRDAGQGSATEGAAGADAPAPAVPRLRELGLDPHRVTALVRALEAGDLLPSALETALDALAADPGGPVEPVLDRFRPLAEPEAADAVEAAVARAVEAAATELPGREPDVVVRWAMGRAMAGLRGRVDPVRVRERLERALERRDVEVTA